MTVHEDMSPRAPNFFDSLSELTTPSVLPRLAGRWRQITSRRPGRGEPVLVLPGFGATDRSTVILRSLLKTWGFDPYGWGLGRNTGNVPALIEEVTRRAEQLHLGTNQPIELVGWSLGGVLAREVARDRPGLVNRIITLGSPVVGGPRYTRVASLFQAAGWSLQEIAQMIDERNRTPILRPITAVYSRRDGIVDWRACIDHWSPRVENVEVGASHLAMAIDPDVLTVVADRLSS